VEWYARLPDNQSSSPQLGWMGSYCPVVTGKPVHIMLPLNPQRTGKRISMNAGRETAKEENRAPAHPMVAPKGGLQPLVLCTHRDPHVHAASINECSVTPG
jgi:hypothetical protein